MSLIEQRIADVLAKDLRANPATMFFTSADHGKHLASVLVAELGLKQEYGIDTPGRKNPNPMVLHDDDGRPSKELRRIPTASRPYRRYVTDWERAE